MSARRLVTLLGSWRRDAGRHAAADLAAAMRLLVLDGRLPVGTRLPAEREFAKALPASRTLVCAALNRLREERLVTSRPGSGTWITLSDIRQPWESFPDNTLIDLARAAPEALPGFAAAVDRARLRLPQQLCSHGYADRGLTELRELLAQRYTARGLPTAPDQLMITSGAHSAFVLILRALASPGDRVMVEQPGYPNALDAVRSLNTTAVPVAMSENGWCADDIEAALRQAAPRLAYLIPEFQNPTGHRMDSAMRERIGAMLRRTSTIGVADETLVELDFSDNPLHGPPPLAAFAQASLITIGSASKSHWGGLRMGWIRASAEIVDRLIAIRSGMDLGPALFEQLILIELLKQPESIMDERRIEFAARRDVLARSLHEHCPQWTFCLPQGGLSLWCRLASAMSTRLAVAAESFGVRLAPGARFGVHGGLERMLRIPFSLPPNELVQAARQLGMATASLEPTSESSTVVAIA